MCGKYIGNYQNGDGNFYSLIRIKYCKACKPIMKNIQSKFSKSNNHKARKLLLNEYIEQVGILQQENKALREMVLDIKNASGKALKQLIREEVCEVLKEILE